jgi:hypothetical protein
VKPGSLTALITFSELDLAIHRTRARYGYKVHEWEALSDDQRYEDLAYDHYRQQRINDMVNPFFARMNADKPISDVGAFYALMLERI